MAKAKKTTARRTAAAWFGQYPVPDPPGWDDKQGWCRRHHAPIAAIEDPAERACVTRLASLDLMVSFASELRRRADPLPVPARHLPALITELAPLCCWLGDGATQAIIIAAQAHCHP